MEDSDVRKRKWSGAVLGKQDCSSKIDSRSYGVKNWSSIFLTDICICFGFMPFLPEDECASKVRVKVLAASWSK